MFVITAQTDNDDTKFMATDFSGRPYWSSSLAAASRFEDIADARKILLSEGFTKDVEGSKNTYPPIMLHQGAKLGKDKLSGSVTISIEQIVRQRITSKSHKVEIIKKSDKQPNNRKMNFYLYDEVKNGMERMINPLNHDSIGKAYCMVSEITSMVNLPLDQLSDDFFQVNGVDYISTINYYIHAMNMQDVMNFSMEEET
jgi:hypothetical protein